MKLRGIYQCSRSIVAMCLLTTLSIGMAEQSIAIGRYVSLPTAAPQTALFQQMKAVYFPATVITVGDAIKIWLQGSGYRLVPENILINSVHNLLTLPLPIVQRHINTIPLITGLQQLIGESFIVLVDPVHRYIDFSQKSLLRNANILSTDRA